MDVLRVPRKVYEYDLLKFAKKLSSIHSENQIEIDISDCENLTPAAILLLFGNCKYWLNDGIDVIFKHEESDFYRYCQRMNFFRLLDIDYVEKFERHDPGDRFVPIVEFGMDSRNDQEFDKDPDELAKSLSDIAVTDDLISRNPDVRQLKRGIIYSSGELIMNVIQHSKGTGYVFAQYNGYKDYVRLAILDNGIGIRESFKIQKSEHFDEDMLNCEAIKKAIDYEVSSKPIGPRFENAGVGLTYLNGIAKIAGVDFTILSNKGFYRNGNEYEHATNLVEGTLCTVTLKRSDLYNFNKVFIEAQNNNLL